MKPFLAISLFFFFGQVFSQDQQLFDTTWYIHKIVVNNQEIYPPDVDDNFSMAHNMNLVNEGQYFFTTGFCDYTDAQMFFEGENSFTLEQDPEVLIGTCNLEESIDFNTAYFNILFYQTGVGDFSYEIITGNEGGLSLIITNSEGDKAYYGDALLSLKHYSKESIVVYPNPAIKEIMIGSDSNSFKHIKIYGVNGNLVMNAALELNQKSITIENLSKGFYILELTDSEDRVSLHKLIKE